MFYIRAKRNVDTSSAVFFSPPGSRGRGWGYLKQLFLTMHHEDPLSKIRELSQGVSAGAWLMVCVSRAFWGHIKPPLRYRCCFCQTSSAQRVPELPSRSSVFPANRNTPSVSHPRSLAPPHSISSAATSVRSCSRTEMHTHTFTFHSKKPH